MRRPSLKNRFGESNSSTDDRITEAIVDALSANDKVIEIRPAKRSRGIGLKRLLLLGAGAIGFAYWVQNSQRPDDLIENVKQKTANRTHQAAEAIEEGSERAGEAVQEAGEKAAERTEDAGEKAAAGTDSDTRGSSRT